MGCCCVNNFCNSPMDNSQRSNIFLLIKDRIGSDSGYQLTFLLCLASLFSVLAGWYWYWVNTDKVFLPTFLWVMGYVFAGFSILVLKSSLRRRNTRSQYTNI